MILLDKIKKALFVEEDEEEFNTLEEENEDLFEPVENADSSKSVIFTKKNTAPINEKIESVKEMSEEDEALIVEAIKKEDNKPKVSKFNITVDTPAKEVSNKPKVKPLERKEYEIPQVVSPIYGSKEDESTDNNLEKINTRVKPKKNPLGTVISPYYGEEQLNEFEENAKMNITVETIEKKQINEVADEDIENISLDKIVSNTEDNEDDMIQFSLFGNDKVIKEDEYTQEIKIQDDDSDEELPF